MKKHYVYYLRRYRRRTVIQAGKKQQEGKCSFSNLTIIRDLTSYLICQKGRNLKPNFSWGHNSECSCFMPSPPCISVLLDSWDLPQLLVLS